MDSQTMSKKVLAGAFVILGTFLILMFIFTLGKDKGLTRAKFQMKVLFMNVGGLSEGAPVRLAGVNVGNVASIDFLRQAYEQRRVQVTVNIFEKYRAQFENNVQFAFYFSGNSNNINYWYIDDVHIYGPITQSFPPSFLQAKTDTLQSKVNLNWNNGSSPDPITGYRIQRKRGLPNDSTNYFVLAETDGITYAYSDTSIQANSVYTYRIQTLSGPGPYGSIWGNEATAYTSDLITASQEENNTITEFILYQNYPNPFNPTTKIKYEIPKLSYVALKVYDILGNDVATIVNEQKPAGIYEVELNASGLPSGVYFYKLRANSVVKVKKMILIR
jgi:hypothetical protein